MKTMIVTYRDGTHATYSVPDDTRKISDLSVPSEQDEQGDLYWTITETDDDPRDIELWIRGNDIRAICLIHTGNLIGPSHQT